MSLLTFTLPRTGQPLLCMCISYRYIHLEVAVEDELLIMGLLAAVGLPEFIKFGAVYIMLALSQVQM